MMQRITIGMAVILLLMGAGSLAAQEADTTAPAPEGAVEAAPAAQEQPNHDWEFTLPATDKAPGASATVMVVDAEQGSDFVVVTNGLPVVDSLDEETRDVNAYTVWIVPAKEKVAESQLVGILTVSPEGVGRLEAHTELETFGVIVTATPDGAPEKIYDGVPVLTGIPVQPAAPAEEAVEEAGEAAEEAVEETGEAAADVAEEAAEVSEEAAEEVEKAAEDAPDSTTGATP